jgi:hypothetical protein
MLQHSGLPFWSAPMFWKNPFLEIPVKQHIFKRDTTPKLGNEQSWSYDVTGEVVPVWVEDAERAVTGYLRSFDDEEHGGTSQRLLVAAPALPERYRSTWRPPNSPYAVSCHFWR